MTDFSDLLPMNMTRDSVLHQIELGERVSAYLFEENDCLFHHGRVPR